MTKLQSLKAFKADIGRRVIVVGPFCWGSGDTGTEAYANCRKHLPRFSRSGFARNPFTFNFYDAPESVTISSVDGALQWRNGEKAPKLIGAYTESKRGAR